MIRPRQYLVMTILALLVIQAGLICAWYVYRTNNKSDLLINEMLTTKITHQVKDLPTHTSYFASQEFYDEAYRQGIAQTKLPEARVYGGIIPHHLIVKDKIAAFFEGLKDYQYSTIILIGPNHFDNGQADIMISEANWQTPYGVLSPDLRLINKLGLSIEEDPFIIEHSISGLVPFIKKTFPRAKIVPIILKSQTTSAKTDELAQLLYDNVDLEKTLILASVDFSHYQNVTTADFHDLKSNTLIQNFDFSRLADLEIDSPASIYTILKYLELAGKQKSELIFSTNSGILINQPDEPTTSHNIFYFTSGDKSDTTAINFLFFGDAMLDRQVKVEIAKNGFAPLIDKLAGEEKRFFWGLDVVMANLEGPIISSGNNFSEKLINNFAFSPDILPEFKKYNFNFFNLANNHLTDHGQQGLTQTREYLADAGFNYAGCSDSQVGQCSSWIKEVEDYKIGMVGLSMVYSKFDLSQAQGIIKNLASTTDLVVVNIHWGTEYQHQFSLVQQEVAHGLIDAGATVIIGHHPHVVQGIEIYQGKPIFYSLGNFIFDQYFSQDTQQGLAVGLNFLVNKASPEEFRWQAYLFPLQSRGSKVELIKGDQKVNFFTQLLDWSELGSAYEGQVVGEVIANF